jgi:hypothetical protein
MDSLKVWLINKIERTERSLKFLNALLIMVSHVEKADDYSDSDDDSDGDSIRACDIRLAEVDTDSDEDDYEEYEGHL